MGKKEYLLIDGYNIIYAWENLKKLSENSLEHARIQLIDILSDYNGVKNMELIVVFDAHLVKNNRGSVEQRHNIKVVYTKEAETADHYIEKASGLLAKDSKVKVVTSDYLEQIIVMSKGAYRISSKEFLQEVEETKKQLRKQYIENRPVKNNLLLDQLDPETAAQLEKMRRQKE